MFRIDAIEKRLLRFIWMQRKPLLLGMFCAAVVSAITVGTFLLLKATVNAIAQRRLTMVMAMEVFTPPRAG